MSDLTIDQFLEAANQLENGFAVYDKDLRLLYANKKAREQLSVFMDTMASGGSYADGVAKQVDYLLPGIPPDIRAAEIKKIVDGLTSGTPFETVDVQKRPIRIQLTKMAGDVVVGVSIDLAKEHAQNQKLRQARKQAEAANEAKSEFLASMSHEIRTPLNGILGMAQALSTRNLNTDELDMVSTILESSKSLMTILNDILDLSKIEAGKLELSPVEGDLRHRLNRLQKFYQPMAEERGLYLKLVIDKDVPSSLVFDTVRIRQCVSNLISNALKFTEQGGVIVAVKSAPHPNRPSEHRIVIHVSDSGIGISEEKHEGLFDKFAQADATTTRKFGGTGLGLAITRKLARMMGGNITLASKPGQGSVFTLSFMAPKGSAEPTTRPAHSGAPTLAQNAPDLATAKQSGTGSEPERGTAKGSLRGKRVLIVDDNAINRRVARLFVEPQGLVVTEAADGKEALDLLGAHPFDLVFLDMHMPVMDGREAIRRIRASSEPWSSIPVIALTADAMSGDREKCLQLGMDGYVPKPIDQRELFVTVLNVLGETGKRSVDDDLAGNAPANGLIGEVDDLFAEFDLASGME